jgi:hypothetical protein
MRLSASSFAGTARTLVAVGRASEVSMFATTRAAAPRSGVVVSCSSTSCCSARKAFCSFAVALFALASPTGARCGEGCFRGGASPLPPRGAGR